MPIKSALIWSAATTVILVIPAWLLGGLNDPMLAACAAAYSFASAMVMAILGVPLARVWATQPVGVSVHRPAADRTSPRE